MSSNIPPKPRLTPKQTFYTAGESDKQITPIVFKAHIAESGNAANIIQRNPCNFEDREIKPKSRFIRCGGYTPGLFSGRGEVHTKEITTEQPISSLAEVKLLKSKEYAQQATKTSEVCAKTIPNREFGAKSQDIINTTSMPVSENWLYCTHAAPIAKNKAGVASDYSEDGPEWFKVKESKMVKDQDITKSKGFDGTVTILSRISGWITVSPKSRNRQHRLGRYGPFNKSKKGNNFQNVSDLAPAWMQTEADRKTEKKFQNVLVPSFVREEAKRMILADKEQPEKCVFSFGDFRHNVTTKEEAERYTRGISENNKRFFEWKEDIPRQRYDKPVTPKIGSIF